MNLLDRASKIAEGFNSSIYQLSDDSYGKEVILKVMKEDFNYHPHSSQLYNEDRFLRNIETKGIRASVDLIEDQQTPILVLEYFDGRSLKDWRKTNNPSFLDCLNIAISVTESIAEIHSKHKLIHRDISAHNILINEKHEIRIIDFGLAINVDIKQSVKGMSDQLLGTLPYISPEQTGRVNHPVDFRSDIYSLGVVFYELFTGRLPFESSDPLEVIHAHLAVAPTAASEINPNIPLVFSNMLSKLLEKNVENRYQSAHGLLTDLKKCRDQLDLKVNIQGFELAENDESGHFQMPSKIYGRTSEIETLTESIRNIGTSQKQLTLVSGKSGTGKTSLIYEVYKPLTSKKGYFIKGKHQQFQKDRPYQAITEALSSFVSLMLSENEKKLVHWKSIIQNALGGQGKLLTDLIPNLELIIGKQEKLPVLGINEAQNRFHYVFGQFIKALASEEHPLVMFIDDLQWADSTSLKLLKQLILDPELNHFYFIGAYRDNEVTSSHPLTLIFKELPRLGVAIQEIHLKDLEFENVQEIVLDTFGNTESKSRLLANIIFGKTAGNPFFVNQFIKSIYENELVWFDTQASKWTWDVRGLESTNFTDNVVEFMIQKLSGMDEKVRKQLTLASCIGDRFDLQTLGLIQENPEDLIEDLWQAVIEQLLIAEENEAEIAKVQMGSFNTQPSLIYRFAHDRIRQAAYELIPYEEKAKVHQRIGEHLLAKIDLKKDPDRVFDVVDQLNLGEPPQTDELRRKIIELNYEAGLKAATATANDSALSYFKAAGMHLTESDWKANHELCYHVFFSIMESNYLIGAYEDMEINGNLLLSRAKTKLEKLETYNIFVQALIAQGKHIELIDYGLSILKTAGIRLPSKPSDLDILQGLLKTKLKLGGKSADYFEQLPDMSDDSMALAINMMSSISTASYHNFPKLFPLVIFKSVQLSLKHGNCIESIPFYGGYGTILCGVMGEYDRGVEFGKLSLSLLARSSEYKAVVPKTLVIYYTFINHWKDHLRESINPAEEAFIVSLEIGDNQYAATSAFQKSYTGFLCGNRLPEVLREMESFLDKMETLNQKGYLLYQKIIYQSLKNLSTSTDFQPWLLEGETFSLKKFESETSELQHDGTANFHIAFHHLYVNYLFGRFEQALVGADKCKSLLDVVVSTAYIPVVHFYDSLTCVKLIKSGKSTEKRKLIKRIKANQKKMKKWADHAPMNFLHKYLVVEAELTSIIKPSTVIKGIYDEAIKNALDNDYLNEAAVIYELAGRHYFATNDESLQLYYLAKALKLYRKWGANTKAEDLKREFPFVYEKRKRDIQSSFSQGTFSFGSISGNNLLDLASVLKAASTISSEIQLSKAIPKLLNIVVENAGAQSGAFVLIQDQIANLHAVCDTEDGARVVDPSPIDEDENLPISVLQYVRRTKDTVILDEPHKDERFQKDSYLIKNKVASMLCLPIIHQQELIGIIYLENRLTKGNFNTDRTDLLSLLSGQIAITVNNALLYDTLEQKVIERTKEIEKQKEKLHRQNKQLTDLNEEKDFLISVVSHDLRNPLQLIKGYTSLVLREKSDNINEYLGHVIESSDRMESFISRILNVSAINSGDIRINWSIQNIVELLKAEVDKFMPASQIKNIDLSLLTEVNALQAQIDKGYFSQVLENLISNALKYTHKNGMVEVSLGLLEGGDYYRIVVKDNGQGISIRDQKLLFSKFQKLSSTPTDGESSTGLGLAIVKKYVEAMNGHIWCESEFEKGSSFFVEFPIEK